MFFECVSCCRFATEGGDIDAWISRWSDHSYPEKLIELI
ncbi:hypothetical protein KPSA3_02138 [Pseudomonas syringae pv. actinidiae]|uniref:Uncharacterized protein n=1 Tax=Pseudomonas syringae pv. actinidiae TaxID=103796 RepID=A0AAN4Q2N4_PSESF|nr:hypothetical protein KPSA3_02138 [Pseudomonas syringae pv. actinidiae]